MEPKRAEVSKIKSNTLRNLDFGITLDQLRDQGKDICPEK
jgi:hypothetical protein